MKRLLTLATAAVITQAAMAIPAKRVAQTFLQPDGTTIELMLRGDETFHYYTTSDGTPMRQQKNGQWVRDMRDVRKLWEERATQRHQQRSIATTKVRRQLAEDALRLKASRRNAPTRAADESSATSKKKGLLILVNFKDVKLSTPEASIHQVYDQILNSEGNPYGNNHGSVHEYFLDQSYGQLDVTFDIVGPVNLPKNMKYYGEDTDGEGGDNAPGEMVYAALDSIKTQVNFADYDWDGDGEVENVYVIYAGYGQASGASSNTIWPHQWDLQSAYGRNFKRNGITVSTYACGSELYGTSGKTLDGVGTMCHEYSHCLGLPDFYDTEGSNFGMSVWSVMDYGCYNGDGYCPAAYTSYERWYNGWLTPTELRSAADISGMRAVEDTAEAYVIYNNANRNEYYLLENHQLRGWDTEAYGHGMLILHVDYDKSAWEENVTNNTSSHQRMTIIPADGKATMPTSYSSLTSALAGDPWPGRSNKTALTDTSSPKASLYNKNTDGTKLMHKPIENITESDGLISFRFMHEDQPALPAPTLNSDVAYITFSAFEAAWSPVENATSYNLQYRTVEQTDEPDGGSVEDAILMDVDFTTVKTTSSRDGSTDVGSRLDTYLNTPGWTGTKVYEGLTAAKIGSSNGGGNVKSPILDVSSGSLTLVLSISHWYSSGGEADNATVRVAILDADGQELQYETTAPDDDYLLQFNFSDVPSACRLFIGTDKGKQRFYLESVTIFDGDFSYDDLQEFFGSDDEGDDDDEDYDDDEDDDDFWNLFAARRLAPKHTALRANRYGEWQTISGILLTRYTVAGLASGMTYEYRVQAVDALGNVSEWSSPQRIQLSGSTAIATTPATPATSAPAAIHDITGRRVTAPRNKGIYIIDGRKVAF